jgi:hypothetical protein
MNFWLQEAGIGYHFENGEIIEVSSQYIHVEAVRPALALLADSRFTGPHQEFLHAHELFRKARPSDAKGLEDSISTALKAFESTLKVICDLKCWSRPPTATAVPLVQVVIDNGLRVFVSQVVSGKSGHLEQQDESTRTRCSNQSYIALFRGIRTSSGSCEHRDVGRSAQGQLRILKSGF